MAVKTNHGIWRLIIDKPARGVRNMAIDEAILEAVGHHEVPTTLRLYAWEPPCLSLGYAQPVQDVEMKRLQSLGWDIVRRPTGGRAILHTDELTYAIIGTPSEPALKGSLLESYRNISRALLAAIKFLGIDASIEQKEPTRTSGSIQNQEAICFEVPSNYEITVNGMKLIGSAQARRKSGILQHGSLPLYGDLARITQVLAYDDEDARENATERLHRRATTVAEILHRQITWEIAAQAFISSFTEVFNIKLIQSDLTPKEIRRTHELVKAKYSDCQWISKSPSYDV